MAKRQTVARLHLLTAREVQTARDGDHADDGGLLPRVRGGSTSWVVRFTAPSGRRREMGLGVARRGSIAQAGESLTAARRMAHSARELLQQGVDPIDERTQRREAARQVEGERKAERSRERLTLLRAARDDHERVIEPSRSAKHGAQWIESIEVYLPGDLLHRPITEIQAPELLAALRAMRPLKGQDDLDETRWRVRQRLDAVFEDARVLPSTGVLTCRSQPSRIPAQTGGQPLATDSSW